MISLQSTSSPTSKVISINNKRANLEILFSYSTPVACMVRWPSGNIEYVRTCKKYSTTTSKHINQWLHNVESVSESSTDLNNIIQYVLDMN